jgi:hypothetical protein
METKGFVVPPGEGRLPSRFLADERAAAGPRSLPRRDSASITATAVGLDAQ